jgi:hypothetical protein
MIYANLPLKCRFIPIDVNDEVFVTIFITYFIDFLDAASKALIAVVDDDDERYKDFNERNIIYYANWAKGVYTVKEEIKEDYDIWMEYCQQTKKKYRIINTVSPYHIGFDISDLSTKNINFGISLWNSVSIQEFSQIEKNILKKINKKGF